MIKMLNYIDKSLIKDIFNSNEFKGWLLSKRWFGDKWILSGLDFNIEINYFEIIAERIFLTVIEIQKGDYKKDYFLPVIYYKRIQEILEPSEKSKENVIKLTESTFSKKIILDIGGENKILTVNLVEAEYCIFFWKKILFDKELAEKFPSISLLLDLYEDQFQDEINMRKVQIFTEAGLYPTQYELFIEQLGKGNTTNLLFLLTIRNIKKPTEDITFVLKSYKEHIESLEPSKLFVLVKNNFPNSPKIYGTVKIKDTDIIGILEAVSNEGNLGDIFWNELNNMLYKTFKDINENYTNLMEKEKVKQVIKENCIETLKVSQQIGHDIEKLHQALILTDDEMYNPKIVDSKSYLNDYTRKLNKMIDDLQNMMSEQKTTSFVNLPKINSILIDIRDIVERFKSEFSEKEIRIQQVHQDLHMEQILYEKIDNNYKFYFIDFEGDPQLSLEEKKSKFPIEKDLASFLRALSYIKFNTLIGFIEKNIIQKDSHQVPEEILYNIYFRKAARPLNDILNVIAKFLDIWEFKLMGKLLKGLKVNYTLITYFYIERTLYELNYEILFRPDKIIVPILGLKEIIERN